jgi:alanine racemase
MSNADLYSTWVEIDLDAIAANAEAVLARAGVPLMGVVKANAYGHGAVASAKAAVRGGAAWCGVARIDEALQLRQAGLDCPILLLGYISPGRISEAINNHISITVWDAEHVARISAIARSARQPARLHLKVDTGMSRLGVQPDNAPDLARLLAGAPRVIFEGLFTHFARADEPDQTSTDRQVDSFRQVVEQLQELGLRPPWIHAANSAASLNRPAAHFNLIRLGISLYGLKPSHEFPLPGELRPALCWKTVLSQVKTLPPGRGVSYGHLYTTHGPERIGTVPVGYGDGFRRVNGNQVLVRGVRVPVVGRVCMDQVMVQLDAVPEAREGDEVVLIGRQGEECITAEEVARQWGTINYEVVCGISARVQRVYI